MAFRSLETCRSISARLPNQDTAGASRPAWLSRAGTCDEVSGFANWESCASMALHFSSSSRRSSAASASRSSSAQQLATASTRRSCSASTCTCSVAFSASSATNRRFCSEKSRAATDVSAAAGATAAKNRATCARRASPSHAASAERTVATGCVVATECSQLMTSMFRAMLPALGPLQDLPNGWSSQLNGFRAHQAEPRPPQTFSSWAAWCPEKEECQQKDGQKKQKIKRKETSPMRGTFPGVVPERHTHDEGGANLPRWDNNATTP
ncbi:hypothetical protein DIPPA_29739 [Diplonema papillatum]|nr:hypothetical protein DIPPA_29739 [Diplonema papillatum]